MALKVIRVLRRDPRGILTHWRGILGKVPNRNCAEGAKVLHLFSITYKSRAEKKALAGQLAMFGREMVWP